MKDENESKLTEGTNLEYSDHCPQRNGIRLVKECLEVRTCNEARHDAGLSA